MELSIKVLILMSLLLSISTGTQCGEGRVVSGALPTEGTQDVLDVRQLELARETLAQKEVVVDGNVLGYHEVVLYEGEAAHPGYFIEIKLPDGKLKELLDSTLKVHPTANGLTGTIRLKGSLVRDAGKLETYPLRLVDNSDSCSGLSAIAVDRFDVTEVIAYVP